MLKSLCKIILPVAAVTAVLVLFSPMLAPDKYGRHSSEWWSTYRPAERPPVAAESTPAEHFVPLAVESPVCEYQAVLHHSLFTDAVIDRVPELQITGIGPSLDEVLFFTEIIGASGNRVSHQWLHNDKIVAEVFFNVESDRYRTWSSKHLQPLGPGTLRVMVRDGDCIIGQQTIVVGETEPADPAVEMATRLMRPHEALEVALAEQADLSQRDEPFARINALDDNGDTPLLAAIRRSDAGSALMLIRAGDPRDPAAPQTRPERDYYIGRADPFYRDAGGASPIDLAHQRGLHEVADALIVSATSWARATSRGIRNSRSKWEDPLIETMVSAGGGNARFSDGDTPLHRAVRTGNERAVVTMLRLAQKVGPAGRTPPGVDLHAFDASGSQAIDIARDLDLYGMQKFLEIATQTMPPPWAVTRATYTTAMQDEEPVNCRRVAFSGEDTLFYFTELTDIPGTRIRHDWWHDDEIVHSQKFDVRTQRWSTVSRRTFTDDDAGLWYVTVAIEGGQKLRREQLEYHVDPYVLERRDNYIGTEGCKNIAAGALLQLAAAHAPVSRFEVLLAKGAELSSKDWVGKEVFQRVVDDGNITLTRWLLDRGFDVNAVLENGSRPITRAIDQDDEAMVRYLAIRGAELNPTKRFVLSPLSYAVRDCKLNMAILLIGAGADPDSTDHNGAGPGNHFARCVKREALRTDHPYFAGWPTR